VLKVINNFLYQSIKKEACIMKKLLYLLPITLFILFSFNLNTMAQDSVFDLDPNVAPADTIPPVGFPLTQKWVFDYTGVFGVSGGSVGAIFFQGKFYLNRWNTGQCYTYLPDANGMPDPATLDSIPNPPYLGNIRDMAIAPDNSGTDYLWGSSATSTLYKMDAGMNVIGTYATGGDFRAIAWDPVTGGFWNGDFSGPATCYDTTGALLASSATGSAVASKYGAAFTTPAQFPGVNSVWWWSQSTGGTLTQVDLASDAIIAQYDFGGVFSAGGAEAVVIGQDNLLLLNFQNAAIAAYVLSVIPVELTSFTASLNQNDVTLNWTTATEINNQGFEIQRSSNGQFERVGYVVGHGTTTEIQNYVFTETNLNDGLHYYRLKQIDYDGTFEYSPIQSIEVISPAVFALEQNFPNPFNPSTMINFSLAADSKVSLTVFDVLGQEVANLISGNLAAGSHEINFNASNVNSGVYFYRIDATAVDGTNFTSVKKMILTK
jgi:hypothetical protein